MTFSFFLCFLFLFPLYKSQSSSISDYSFLKTGDMMLIRCDSDKSTWVETFDPSGAITNQIPSLGQLCNDDAKIRELQNGSFVLEYFISSNYWVRLMDNSFNFLGAAVKITSTGYQYSTGTAGGIIPTQDGGFYFNFRMSSGMSYIISNCYVNITTMTYTSVVQQSKAGIDGDAALGGGFPLDNGNIILLDSDQGADWYASGKDNANNILFPPTNLVLNDSNPGNALSGETVFDVKANFQGNLTVISAWPVSSDNTSVFLSVFSLTTYGYVAGSAVAIHSENCTGCANMMTSGIAFLKATNLTVVVYPTIMQKSTSPWGFGDQYSLLLAWSLMDANKVVVKNGSVQTWGNLDKVMGFSDGSFVIIYENSTTVQEFYDPTGKFVQNLTLCPVNKACANDQTTCVNWIANCSTYNPAGKCLKCKKKFAFNGTACIPLNVTYCETYNADITACISCQNNLKLSVTGFTCLTPNITNCSTYNDDISCNECQNGSILTDGHLHCVQPNISGCVNYADNLKCSKCDNTTNLTIGNLACATPIPKCLTYLDSKLCASCDNTTNISIDGTTCVQPIDQCLTFLSSGKCNSCNESHALSETQMFCVPQQENCSNYMDNTTCIGCIANHTFTVNKSACVAEILNCASYYDNGSCFQCKENTTFSINNKICAKNIANCQVYNENASCGKCVNNQILILSNTSCTNPITNCTDYHGINNCSTCAQGSAVTVGFVACAPLIGNCTTYADNLTCQTCDNTTILILTNTMCSNIIDNCAQYSAIGKCSACQTDYTPSSDFLSCKMNYVALNTTQIVQVNPKILSNSSDSEKGVNYLKKNASEHASLSIFNTFDSSYTMSLPKPFVIFVESGNNSITANVSANYSFNSTSNSMKIFPNILNVPSGLYKFNATIGFKKSQRVLLETNGSTPSNFLLDYQSNEVFYVGNDTEVAQQKANQVGTTATDDGPNLNYLAFLCLLIIPIAFGIYYCQRKKNKSRGKDQFTEPGEKLQTDVIFSPNEAPHGGLNKV